MMIQLNHKHIVNTKFTNLEILDQFVSRRKHNTVVSYQHHGNEYL